MFLHYLVTRPASELLAKFFDAQKKYPVKNDWWLTCKDNMDELGLQMGVEEIAMFSKKSFKNLIKRKVKAKVLDHLTNEKSKHKKMAHLNYTEL